MLRNLCLVFVFLFVGVAQISAQQMIVRTSDGGETKFEESDYGLCKITFFEGKMLFHVGDKVESTIDIKNIQRVSFYGSSNGVGMVAGEKTITYSSDAENLIVNALPGTLVKVYHANGTCVLSQLQAIAPSPISVEYLSAGMYVVVVGSETLKFVRK